MLDDYRAYLESKGGTDKHVDGTIHAIAAVAHECGFATLGDLDAPKVMAYLAAARQRGKRPKLYPTKHGLKAVDVPFGPRAYNAVVTAVKGFAHWLYVNGLTRSDTMVGLARDTKGERSDSRHPRRALADEEIGWLLWAAEHGPDFRGISAPDRAMAYRLALGTAFGPRNCGP